MHTVAPQPGAAPQPWTANKNAVPEADVHTVRSWLEAGDALLVDVREAEEFEEERIPGVVMAPMSVFDPERRRSRAAAAQLLQEGHVNLFNMTGGLYAWKDASYPTAL